MALNHVFVTNTNSFTHQDRYDGEDYVFPPNVPVMIPMDAAEHMFGYHPPEARKEGEVADYTNVLVRLGWASKYDPAVKNFVEDPEGSRKLANFVFEEAVVQPKSALARAIEGASEPEIA